MDTGWPKLSRFVASHGLEVKVMGAPKTVDNDLCGTDHTPGFGSAAKYVASTFAELARDVSVYDIKAVTIVEVMDATQGGLPPPPPLPGKMEKQSPSWFICRRFPFLTSVLLRM